MTVTRMGAADREGKMMKRLFELQELMLGYPSNLAYDYSPLVIEKPYLFSLKLNNIGSPFQASPYKIHTKECEREVLEFFCKLWNFEESKVWGYITANGTEGNTQGLFVARKIYPNGVLYYSKCSHYSIKKIATMLRMPSEQVDASDNGEMDYKDFERKLLANKEKPAIICLNLGTTMHGAIDNCREIFRILFKHKKHKEYYMHADGALMGFLLPFYEKDMFYLKYIHSISISGHKFLGVPFPCGVFMKDTSVRRQSEDDFVEYVQIADCTVSGSRSGQSAVFLHWIIEQKKMEGFEKDAIECMKTADYLINELIERGYEAWRNNNSITVLIEKPCSEICDKWQLATQGNLAHVICLPHVTQHKIDLFIQDIVASQVNNQECAKVPEGQGLVSLMA